MKKIDWKDVWRQARNESKKHGNIEGPEKWALYVVVVFLAGVCIYYDKDQLDITIHQDWG